MSDARKALAAVHGGQAGKGDWVWFVSPDLGAVTHHHVEGVYRDDHWPHDVFVLADGRMMRPHRCYLDQGEAVAAGLAEAMSEASRRRVLADEAAAAVDRLRVMGAVCGITDTPGPETYPLDAAPRRQGGAG